MGWSAICQEILAEGEAKSEAGGESNRSSCIKYTGYGNADRSNYATTGLTLAEIEFMR